MISVKNEELVAAACAAMEHSYSPYSGFRVGAAVLAQSGRVYSGCNIENASYGATICAERCAIFSGIAQGERRFNKLAVVSSGDGYPWPCGICRQVLLEFMPPESSILLKDKGKILELTLEELMPHGFTKEALSFD